MPFIPHTDGDVTSMLDVIGVAGMADLFDEIPAALKAGLPLINFFSVRSRSFYRRR